VTWKSNVGTNFAVDAAGTRLAHLVKSTIGVTVEVRVVSPGMVERALGKAKRVVDKRPRG